jgi:drug/metabolite transporter (DMT)-like permease
MIYLIFSVITNAAIYWLFKYFEQIEAKIFETIVFNYIVAFTCGIFFVPNVPEAIHSALQFPIWSVAGLIMGSLFISVFYFMAITAKKSGIAMATLSSKMSLVLAVIVLAFLGEGEITLLKAIALMIAMFGLYLFSVDRKSKFNKDMLLYPVILMLGSTCVDTSIAYFPEYTSNENELYLFKCLPFLGAGIIGISILLYKMIFKKETFPLKELGTGILLGFVNYGSIFFTIEFYHSGWMPESTALPVNNLLVLVTGSIGAVFIFKEKINRRKIQGLIICILALILLL